MSYGHLPGGGHGPYGGYGPHGGYGYNAPPPGEPPKDYLAHNILGILSCVPVIGIIGLIFAIQVKSQWRRGDYMGAESSARTAKILGIIGLALFIPVVLYVLFLIGGMAYMIVTEG
jgi:hypothetical protein